MSTATMSRIKKQVAIADLLLVIALMTAISAQDAPSPWDVLLRVQFPLVFGAFWFFLARLKCPHCGRRLSQDFPLGSLVALPFAKQPCKHCGNELAK